MRIAESWLREWASPECDSEALAEQLTMLGHEVDSLHYEGEGLDGVVVAEVLECDKHPDADRLSVCKVSAGSGEPLQIVCGAPNVVAGMKTPLAVPGVKLPNGLKLRKTKIRGVESHGMLCSAVELGLGDESDGIMRLPDDAPAGAALGDYLGLPDAVIDVDLTPNRGDCFSMLGIARDVAAATGAKLKAIEVDSPPAVTKRVQTVELPVPEACPVFAGRVIEGIDPGARSPLWMTERLRRAGLRAIYPVVDVTNYVMLELGQPLHGYDLDKLNGTIRPCVAKGGESLTLLDGKAISLSEGTVTIEDDSGVIGLAGIMGGLSTAVDENTSNVFFEAAFWPPEYMAGRARGYGLHTDASLRFERGADPTGQARAVERATELLLAIAGGKPGPLNTVEADGVTVGSRTSVRLRRSRLERLLGTSIPDAEVVGILERLGFAVTADADGWDAVPPSHRFDIEIEADLIEEVARLHGYDRMPIATATAETPLAVVPEARIDLERVAVSLIARDYQEVITYSFVDEPGNTAVAGQASSLVLSNPISSEMSVMRSSLWPGLLHAAAGNLARQQHRIRLFEIGKAFSGSPEAPAEALKVAGLIAGPALGEQWGSKERQSDFFDIKADVQALLDLSGNAADVVVVAGEHAALQQGQAAVLERAGKTIGVLGKLHPAVAKRFDIKKAVFVFELDVQAALEPAAPHAGEVSRFPAIRRDIAVLVDKDISAADLQAAVREAAGTLIKDVRIFDIYTGPGIEAGLKSVALGLILQETSRTLTDHDADSAMAAAVQILQEKFAARLRE